ncbi:outer membrane protein OmpA-like peptidoglycan-associated protein [Azoarcus indigens]|uniref:Outer membrane protein OmpA-like peptidoglycan-associated protein n=2 Tax=Azoarcus indigens TaxID=29545 RepID=A0A4R6DU11_9RHOO|nr:outer membrane protein OmpA-like peptidoglycan-associated protein [Azoarcus indigens]
MRIAMNSARRAFLSRSAAGLIGALLLAGCAPQSYLVLLENPGGGNGKVLVTGASGRQAGVERAGDALALNADGPRPLVVDADQVQRDFGAALAAQPPLPESFLLYFEGGERLTAESLARLPDILAAIARRPAADVSIIGHTDTMGNASANEGLGLARAEAVRKLLESEGAKPLEMNATSHGERNPLIPTPDETQEPRNRRVEVTVR